MWSDYNYEATVAESWTLNAKAHTAYVVRVYHQADTTGFNNWNGDVWLYGRNAGGDAIWAGGYWGSFGPTNTNGQQHQDRFEGQHRRAHPARDSATNPPCHAGSPPSRRRASPTVMTEPVTKTPPLPTASS